MGEIREEHIMSEPRPEWYRDLRWDDLDAVDKGLICNGCGAKGGWIKPPKSQFEASCDHHDFGYWKGGTEKDRKICDVKFLQAMMKDALYLSWWERPVHMIVAIVYYIAVRLCGKKAFHYGKRKGLKALSEMHEERIGKR